MIAEDMAGLPSEIAAAIARADMLVDYRPDTTSFCWSELGVSILNNITGVAQDYHFPSDEQLASAMDTALSTLDPGKLGESLHTIQDSFSHFGFKDNHVAATVGSKFSQKVKNPDDPKSNINSAADMAMLTLDILRAYRIRLQIQKALTAIASALFAVRI